MMKLSDGCVQYQIRYPLSILIRLCYTNWRDNCRFMYDITECCTTIQQTVTLKQQSSNSEQWGRKGLSKKISLGPEHSQGACFTAWVNCSSKPSLLKALVCKRNDSHFKHGLQPWPPTLIYILTECIHTQLCPQPTLEIELYKSYLWNIPFEHICNT